MAKRTFFDQWYRIANLRVGLRHTVSSRQTRYRNEIWYVYHEPIYNGFFRARPETHALIGKISPTLTLAEIWKNAVQENPEIAPGQEEFFDLVSSLYRSNLLFVEGAVNEARLLDRSFRKKSKPLAAQISELFFLKIPLWDPDSFLSRHLRIIDAIFSRQTIIAVLILMLCALGVFVVNADRAFAQGAGILQPHNLLSLFLATFVTHIFHEMAHAALCKRFGGDVRSMGIMLMMFAPLPFADVSSSWLMRNSNHRAAIGAAGMFSDLTFCAIATLFWAYSPPGAANEIALNVMFTTMVYTFVFNINPLMRFDGYYILSDLMKVPNLHQRSKNQFKAMWRHRILEEPIPPEDIVSKKRRLFLVSFFLSSFVYRNVVSIGIVLFLADQYFGLGLIGAAAIAFTSFIKPVWEGFKEWSSPHFRARHRKPLRRGAWIGVGVLLFLVVIPMPDFRRVQGVVESVSRVPIHAQVDAEIAKVLAVNGVAVKKGEPLFVLQNEDLQGELSLSRAKESGARIRLSQSLAQNGRDIAAIQREIETIRSQRADIERRLAALTITAPDDGVWVAQQGAEALIGKWVTRGGKLGEVLHQGALRFRGVLPQAAAFGLADVRADQATVRVTGDLDQRLAVGQMSVVPYSSKDLPSASLSPMGGGDLSVSQTNPEKIEAVERFFLVDAVLAATTLPEVAEGRSAWMRLRLPARPLAFQWKDALAQFLQQRYKL